MSVPKELKIFHNKITTRRKIVQNLHQVIDPELGVNMVDLGLVYKIDFDEDGKVTVVYTATTPGCPMRRYFQHKVEEALELVEEVDDFEARLSMEPQWSIEMMAQELKQRYQQPRQPAWQRW